ncbi:MAG: PD-(D/E)XK nuclease-like domain-containing protein [Pirellulales bacterium]
MNTPEPGIYYDIDFEDYLAWDAVSNSRMNLARRSLMHYQAGWKKKPTAAMRRGSLVHCGSLEPLEFQNKYVVLPQYELSPQNVTLGGKRTTSKVTTYYKGMVEQFTEASQGKEIVSQDWFDSTLGLIKALKNHELAGEWLCNDDPAEVSFIWQDQETGLYCKGRIDKWQNKQQRFIDLKTCADPIAFGKSIAIYGYHRQAAFYQEGIAQLAGGELHEPCIVAVETEDPWGIRAAPISEEWLMIGRQEVRSTLTAIAEANEDGTWPGYDSPESWLPPSWYEATAGEEVVLKVGGKTLTV